MRQTFPDHEMDRDGGAQRAGDIDTRVRTNGERPTAVTRRQASTHLPPPLAGGLGLTQ